MIQGIATLLVSDDWHATPPRGVAVVPVSSSIMVQMYNLDHRQLAGGMLSGPRFFSDSDA